MGFAPSRGIRRQEYSVTKKKGSRPWNLKKWQLGCFIPPCEIDNGKFTNIYGGQTMRQTNRFGSQGIRRRLPTYG
jgi:hypothetical protein